MSNGSEPGGHRLNITDLRSGTEAVKTCPDVLPGGFTQLCANFSLTGEAQTDSRSDFRHYKPIRSTEVSQHSRMAHRGLDERSRPVAEVSHEVPNGMGQALIHLWPVSLVSNCCPTVVSLVSWPQWQHAACNISECQSSLLQPAN